jgi:hypothetical protein
MKTHACVEFFAPGHDLEAPDKITNFKTRQHAKLTILGVSQSNLSVMVASRRRQNSHELHLHGLRSSTEKQMLATKTDELTGGAVHRQAVAVENYP